MFIHYSFLLWCALVTVQDTTLGVNPGTKFSYNSLFFQYFGTVEQEHLNRIVEFARRYGELETSLSEDLKRNCDNVLGGKNTKIFSYRSLQRFMCEMSESVDE